MSTASLSSDIVATPPSHRSASVLIRLGVALRAVWGRTSVHSAAVDAGNKQVSGATEAIGVPVKTKIAAISIQGNATKPARKVPAPGSAEKSTKPSTSRAARRPGVQGRWKASDRVAMM